MDGGPCEAAVGRLRDPILSKNTFKNEGAMDVFIQMKPKRDLSPADPPEGQ